MSVCPFSRVCFTSNNHQSLRVAYQKAAEGSEKSEKSPYLLQGRSQQLNDKREAARTRQWRRSHCEGESLFPRPLTCVALGGDDRQSRALPPLTSSAPSPDVILLLLFGFIRVYHHPFITDSSMSLIFPDTDVICQSFLLFFTHLFPYPQPFLTACTVT